VDNGHNATAECFSTASEWAEWLDKRHATSKGVWLRLAKKGSEEDSIAFIDALDIALCYGWVDQQKQRVDDDWWLQRFTPRPATAKWGRRACERAQALIKAGRMRPAGQAEVDRAREDGRWEEAAAKAEPEPVPPDFQAELDRSRRASSFFSALDAHNRTTMLERLSRVQRPEARHKRICEYIEMLERRQRLHP
jgi:uncharacterized protein YdeI (YjbR/CyaY-like superfamily)